MGAFDALPEAVRHVIGGGGSGYTFGKDLTGGPVSGLAAEVLTDPALLAGGGLLLGGLGAAVGKRLGTSLAERLAGGAVGGALRHGLETVAKESLEGLESPAVRELVTLALERGDEVGAQKLADTFKSGLYGRLSDFEQMSARGPAANFGAIASGGPGYAEDAAHQLAVSPRAIEQAAENVLQRVKSGEEIPSLADEVFSTAHRVAPVGMGDPYLHASDRLPAANPLVSDTLADITKEQSVTPEGGRGALGMPKAARLAGKGNLTGPGGAGKTFQVGPNGELWVQDYKTGKWELKGQDPVLATFPEAGGSGEESFSDMLAGRNPGEGPESLVGGGFGGPSPSDPNATSVFPEPNFTRPSSALESPSGEVPDYLKGLSASPAQDVGQAVRAQSGVTIDELQRLGLSKDVIEAIKLSMQSRSGLDQDLTMRALDSVARDARAGRLNLEGMDASDFAKLVDMRARIIGVQGAAEAGALPGVSPDANLPTQSLTRHLTSDTPPEVIDAADYSLVNEGLPKRPDVPMFQSDYEGSAMAAPPDQPFGGSPEQSKAMELSDLLRRSQQGLSPSAVEGRVPELPPVEKEPRASSGALPTRKDVPKTPPAKEEPAKPLPKRTDAEPTGTSTAKALEEGKPVSPEKSAGAGELSGGPQNSPQRGGLLSRLFGGGKEPLNELEQEAAANKLAYYAVNESSGTHHTQALKAVTSSMDQQRKFKVVDELTETLTNLANEGTAGGAKDPNLLLPERMREMATKLLRAIAEGRDPKQAASELAAVTTIKPKRAIREAKAAIIRNSDVIKRASISPLQIEEAVAAAETGRPEGVVGPFHSATPSRAVLEGKKTTLSGLFEETPLGRQFSNPAGSADRGYPLETIGPVPQAGAPKKQVQVHSSLHKIANEYRTLSEQEPTLVARANEVYQRIRRSLPPMSANALPDMEIAKAKDVKKALGKIVDLGVFDLPEGVRTEDVSELRALALRLRRLMQIEQAGGKKLAKLSERHGLHSLIEASQNRKIIPTETGKMFTAENLGRASELADKMEAGSISDAELDELDSILGRYGMFETRQATTRTPALPVPLSGAGSISSAEKKSVPTLAELLMPKSAEPREAIAPPAVAGGPVTASVDLIRGSVPLSSPGQNELLHAPGSREFMKRVNSVMLGHADAKTAASGLGEKAYQALDAIERLSKKPATYVDGVHFRVVEHPETGERMVVATTMDDSGRGFHPWNVPRGNKYFQDKSAIPPVDSILAAWRVDDLTSTAEGKRTLDLIREAMNGQEITDRITSVTGAVGGQKKPPKGSTLEDLIQSQREDMAEDSLLGGLEVERARTDDTGMDLVDEELGPGNEESVKRSFSELKPQEDEGSIRSTRKMAGDFVNGRDAEGTRRFIDRIEEEIKRASVGDAKESLIRSSGRQEQKALAATKVEQQATSYSIRGRNKRDLYAVTKTFDSDVHSGVFTKKTDNADVILDDLEAFVQANKETSISRGFGGRATETASAEEVLEPGDVTPLLEMARQLPLTEKQARRVEKLSKAFGTVGEYVHPYVAAARSGSGEEVLNTARQWAKDPSRNKLVALGEALDSFHGAVAGGKDTATRPLEDALKSLSKRGDKLAQDEMLAGDYAIRKAHDVVDKALADGEITREQANAAMVRLRRLEQPWKDAVRKRRASVVAQSYSPIKKAVKEVASAATGVLEKLKGSERAGAQVESARKFLGKQITSHESAKGKAVTALLPPERVDEQLSRMLQGKPLTEGDANAMLKSIEKYDAAVRKATGAREPLLSKSRDLLDKRLSVLSQRREDMLNMATAGAQIGVIPETKYPKKPLTFRDMRDGIRGLRLESTSQQAAPNLGLETERAAAARVRSDVHKKLASISGAKEEVVPKMARDLAEKQRLSQKFQAGEKLTEEERARSNKLFGRIVGKGKKLAPKTHKLSGRDIVEFGAKKSSELRPGERQVFETTKQEMGGSGLPRLYPKGHGRHPLMNQSAPPKALPYKQMLVLPVQHVPANITQVVEVLNKELPAYRFAYMNRPVTIQQIGGVIKAVAEHSNIKSLADVGDAFIASEIIPQVRKLAHLVGPARERALDQVVAKIINKAVVPSGMVADTANKLGMALIGASLGFNITGRTKGRRGRRHAVLA